MKTRNLVLVIVLLAIHLLPTRASAQGMPVYDNTNFISLTKSLIESTKQTAELLKTVEFLKEQKDNIVKVNRVIGQLKAAREITRNHERLFHSVRGELREILSSPYIQPEEVAGVSDAFETIMATAIDDLELIADILSSDFLKMSDAERTEILLAKKQASDAMVAEITKKTERYRDIIAFRKMQDRINNRAASY